VKAGPTTQKIKLRDHADETILAQARVDAERWIDEGGSFRPEAVSSVRIGEPMDVIAAQPAARYRCPCQHVFQAFGLGRHRRYYELTDLGWHSPLMGRACPSCQRRLPGKN
jgi:hypothetical protein